MNAQSQLQRDVARISLDSVGHHGFALAGAGAIREHGLTARPTQDVDLFTNQTDVEMFQAAAEVSGCCGEQPQDGYKQHTFKSCV